MKYELDIYIYISLKLYTDFLLEINMNKLTLLNENYFTLMKILSTFFVGCVTIIACGASEEIPMTLSLYILSNSIIRSPCISLAIGNDLANTHSHTHTHTNGFSMLYLHPDC